MSDTTYQLIREAKPKKDKKDEKFNSDFEHQNCRWPAGYENCLDEIVYTDSILLVHIDQEPRNDSRYQQQEQLAVDQTYVLSKQRQALDATDIIPQGQIGMSGQFKVELNKKDPQSICEVLQLMKASSTKDQTKNIPKNFIKAIFTFIDENPIQIKRLLFKKRDEFDYVSFPSFMEFVGAQKKIMVFTILRLKNLWTNEDYGKILRMIFAHFLRRRSLTYIMTSKIGNKFSHIKYRSKLLQSIGNPGDFSSIK